MTTRIAILVAGALVAAVGPIAAAGPPLRNTYVLTQAYCLAPQASAPGKCHMQEIPVGATLEIQLPGTPSVWTVASLPSTLEAAGSNKLSNPNRTEGTNEVYIFSFKAVKAGAAPLVFKEAPAFLSKPVGSFTFPITVK